MLGLQWAGGVGAVFGECDGRGRVPKLSLAIYLLMGWSVLLIIKPVWERLSVAALVMLLAEGVLYTAGTFFFTNDNRRHFHAIWHIFVLLGAMAHWTAVLLILLD